MKYSGVPSYPEVNRAAVVEMHRQVGPLALDGRSVAYRGLLIRHLVMPRDLAGSRATLDFIASRLGKDAYVNIMAQYHPAYRASEHEALSRRLTPAEYAAAVEHACRLGLHRGFPDL